MNVTQLKYELIRRGIRSNIYRLEIGLPSADEQYCLVREGAKWEVYYAERGHKGALELFDDESAACDRFLSRVSKDPTAID